MHYITVTELESPGSTSCKIQGLQNHVLRGLENCLQSRQVPHINNESLGFFEADIKGVNIINMLSSEYNYRVAGQSMVIEVSNIGGRTDKVQKLTWTLVRQ